ncbi:polysaccharide biosynthesis/export family protein [Saccharicrinis aurantiacus]|uniref:polysaccharide biosynthesis/export family protein n=1 Tax=Saccharicrinis aurantiacus TaxID=1849719 RepID=UPI0008398813|nr:polysaccharide biosynthesis/export family protein [Saccharicrinis aurantiacus]
MQKNTSLNLLTLIILTLYSCQPQKDLVYFNNSADNEALDGMLSKSPDYKIRQFDNLFVDIQTSNPEVNQLFKATSDNAISRGGLQQNFGQPALQYLSGYLVDANGDIVLPMLGDIKVEGLTFEEARSIISEKASEYLKDVTVKVKFLSYRITVLGEVKNPGVYYNYNPNLSVLDGISMARGVATYGRIKKVLVMRNTPEGSTTYRLDLTDKNVVKSPAFFLQPNDVLMVEPLKNKNIVVSAPIFSLLFSAVSSLVLILNYIE